MSKHGEASRNIFTGWTVIDLPLIIGKAEEFARVRAGINTLFTAFDNEEWQTVTSFASYQHGWATGGI